MNNRKDSPKSLIALRIFRVLVVLCNGFLAGPVAGQRNLSNGSSSNSANRYHIAKSGSECMIRFTRSGTFVITPSICRSSTDRNESLRSTVHR